jgi:hypothetical protein
VYCHHHQNPRAGNALTISPFLVDDDNHTNNTGDLENVDGAPPECEHLFRICFWNAKVLILGSMLPLDFIDQPMAAKYHNRQQAYICRERSVEQMIRAQLSHKLH